MENKMGNQNSLTVGEILEIAHKLREMQSIIRTDMAMLDEQQESLKADKLKEINHINYLIERLNNQKIQ